MNTQWNLNCKTWDETTFEWTTWYYNHYVDNGDWVQCADGEFYTEELYMWQDWGSSCNKLWGYRDECFECPSGEYLDLATMQWVTECNQDTQIAINDTQFGNRLICRDFEYYVNPDSDSIIELGTMDYPYKDISYVFIELLNYHSYSVRFLSE